MRAIKLEKSDNQTKLRTPDRIEKSTFNFPFSLGSKIFYDGTFFFKLCSNRSNSLIVISLRRTTTCVRNRRSALEDLLAYGNSYLSLLQANSNTFLSFQIPRSARTRKPLIHYSKHANFWHFSFQLFSNRVTAPLVTIFVLEE